MPAYTLAKIASKIDSFLAKGIDIKDANTVSSTSSMVGAGAANVISSDNSFIAGGSYNTGSANYSFVGGGIYNSNSGRYGFVGAGSGNLVSNTGGAILNGENNSIVTRNSIILGGSRNLINGGFGQSNFIANGSFNKIIGSNYALIGNGFENSLSGDFNFILGGSGNLISGDSTVNSCVLNGEQNNIGGGCFGTVLQGYNNQAVDVYLGSVFGADCIANQSNYSYIHGNRITDFSSEYCDIKGDLLYTTGNIVSSIKGTSSHINYSVYSYFNVLNSNIFSPTHCLGLLSNDSSSTTDSYSIMIGDLSSHADNYGAFINTSNSIVENNLYSIIVGANQQIRTCSSTLCIGGSNDLNNFINNSLFLGNLNAILDATNFSIFGDSNNAETVNTAFIFGNSNTLSKVKDAFIIAGTNPNTASFSDATGIFYARDGQARQYAEFTGNYRAQLDYANGVSLTLPRFTGAANQLGLSGELRQSGTYLYVCTGAYTNGYASGWGRIQLTTF